MRVIFMGTPEFAVPTLQFLIDDGHDIAAVYTQPARPSGRGHKLTPSPIQTLAEKHGLEVRTPLNFKADADRQALKELKPEIGVVAAYGLILPQKILDIPKHGFLNVHGSLLPRWRGAAPIHRAILEGDQKTGITIMRMEAGLDTGPMLLSGETEISSKDTFSSVHERMAQLGGGLMAQALAQLDSLKPVAQPERGVSYAHKITKEDGVLKGDETAQQIDRMVRALTPSPGVWFIHKNERFKILSGAPRAGGGNFHGHVGDILDSGGAMLCAQGTVYQIDKLQGPNGRAMDMAGAINGGLIACASN